MIVEHFNSQCNAFLKIDRVLLGGMLFSPSCVFGIDCAPLNEVSTWKLHGDVGLPDVALEGAEMD